MTRSDNSGPAVEEIQGLYGPFTFSEKLLQQIWAQGDFDRAWLVTTTGRRVRVLHPGRWNLLGGPDFKQARLRLDDGPEVMGDVELHLHANAWEAHGHAADRAYAGVCLHVVLFPPPAGWVTRGTEGREIPIAALLPLLHCDLEEYAAEAAVAQLAGRSAGTSLVRVLAEWRGWPLEALRPVLQQHSEARWRQKVHFARKRIERLGWTEACHHAALEILGYRFNRSPMLWVAGAHPLTDWAAGKVDPAAVYAGEAWQAQAVRPANHPRTRLRQYAAWCAQVPDWPMQLTAFGAGLPELSPAAATTVARKEAGLTTLRAAWAECICRGQVGGTRWDNLVCDGWLPLLAAQSGRDLRGVWHHWFPGDLPPVVVRALRELGVFAGRSQPACHGLAQGLLGALLERKETGL